MTLIIQFQQTNNHKLSTPIKIVLYFEAAPPINPLACTKVISLIPEIYTSFSISLIPRHYYFIGLLDKNEPYYKGTA